MTDRRPVDPALFEPLVMRRALAQRDIPAVYRMLTAAGVTQRRIAELTGSHTSEVSAIVRGHMVQSYAVLVRIAEGLQVPRGWLGLAYGDADEASTTYSEAGGHPIEEVDDDMRRRALLAAAAVAVVGRPVLGDLLHLPAPPATATPLPARLGGADVDAVRALAATFRSLGRSFGGQAQTVSATAVRSMRLLAVPATDSVQRALGVALAELHAVAGWNCADSRMDDAARGHFATGMELAHRAGDTYWTAMLAWLGGVVPADHGGHDDALKLFQLARMTLDRPTGAVHPRALILTGRVRVDSALSLAQMDRPDLARGELAAARQTGADDADTDQTAALVELHVGRLDVAEQYAAAAVRRWNGSSNRRDATLGDITRATIHAQAGEPTAARLATKAIDGAAQLLSQRVRDRLTPLAEALAGRDSTCRDLAQRIRTLQRDH